MWPHTQSMAEEIAHFGNSHKAEIYKYLWMLMSEGDPALFQESMEAFQTVWKTKESGFISYFKDYYV